MQACQEARITSYYEDSDYLHQTNENVMLYIQEIKGRQLVVNKENEYDKNLLLHAELQWIIN